MANKAQLYRYKGNRCEGCNKSVEDILERFGTIDRVFEFHHVNPTTKHSNYSNLIRRTISSEQLDEIDKCALLCRECHGIIHAQNYRGKITKTIQIEGRNISQTLTGWFRLDRRDMRLTFVTNEQVLLLPCTVKVGEEDTIGMALLEIIDAANLIEWFRGIAVNKHIQISAASDGRFLMRIEHLGENSVQITQVPGIPLAELEFTVIEGDTDKLWMRNGLILTKEGRVFNEEPFRYTIELNSSIALRPV